MTNSGNASEASRSKPLLINRTLNQPVKTVWQAWSDPQTFKKWWGPRDFTCPECKIDFRVGGTVHAAMRNKEGQDTWSIGTFKEIVPEKKIVVTDSFADKDGKKIPASDLGMPGDWPEECLITLEFKDKGDQTEMRLRHDGIPAEMHDDCVQGWNESLDKIEEL